MNNTILLFVLMSPLFFSCTQQPHNPGNHSTKDQNLNQVTEVLHDSNAIEIRMRDDSIIMIEEMSVHLDSLPKYLKAARKIKGKDAPVSLYVQARTPYGIFSGVHLILEDELYQFRDEEALSQYGKHYEALDKTQQSNINEIHHLRIIENPIR